MSDKIKIARISKEIRLLNAGEEQHGKSVRNWRAFGKHLLVQTTTLDYTVNIQAKTNDLQKQVSSANSKMIV